MSYLSRRLFSSAASFRRVVITGLGAVTPLGCGVDPTWRRLIGGECGVRAITQEDLRMDGLDEATSAYTYDQLPSKVAAVVPRGKGEEEFNEETFLQSKDGKSMSRFIMYALCAADEALRDANWLPTETIDLERTVEGSEASLTF